MHRSTRRNVFEFQMLHLDARELERLDLLRFSVDSCAVAMPSAHSNRAKRDSAHKYTRHVTEPEHDIDVSTNKLCDEKVGRWRRRFVQQL